MDVKVHVTYDGVIYQRQRDRMMMTVKTRRDETTEAPKTERLEDKPNVAMVEPTVEDQQDSLVSDTDDEFSGIEVIEVEKAPVAVTPLDKIAPSVRQYVAQVTGTGKPLLIPVKGWDDKKRAKFIRQAKAVSPYLPDGKKVSVKPSLHKGQEVLTLDVYKPAVRKPATDVPPVSG